MLANGSSKTNTLDARFASCSSCARKNASASVLRSPALSVFLKLGLSAGVAASPRPSQRLLTFARTTLQDGNDKVRLSPVRTQAMTQSRFPCRCLEMETEMTCHFGTRLCLDSLTFHLTPTDSHHRFRQQVFLRGKTGGAYGSHRCGSPLEPAFLDNILFAFCPPESIACQFTS